MGTMRTFEELEAWQACRAFKFFLFRETVPKLIERKEFALADNLKRAARSTTNNTAEGYGRFHYRDNYKFCSNARGSLFESLDHLITADDEDYLPEQTSAQARSLFDNALQLLNGYMAYLKRAADAPNNK